MNLRRALTAMLVACGLCVWGFVHSGDEPARARTAESAPAETEEDGDTRDEAAARYRAGQSRHWRHVAIGSSTNR